MRMRLGAVVIATRGQVEADQQTWDHSKFAKVFCFFF
jgi:hypothetical protein